MFMGAQGMSIYGNAASATAASAASASAVIASATATYAVNAAAASAAATSAATVADKAKMCSSSLIFRGVKWCFYLVSGATSPEPPPRK